MADTTAAALGSTLTVEYIREVTSHLKAHDTFPIIPKGARLPYDGARIIIDPNALEAGERLFPDSPHRSARVRKKLIKRLGGEFRMVPTSFSLPDGTLIVHPVIEKALNEVLAAQKAETERQMTRFGMGLGLTGPVF